MRAGLLRDRVTLQILSKAPGAYGQLVPGWTDGPTYSARVRTPYGSEQVQAGQLQAKLTHVVEMRHPGVSAAADINPNNRLDWGGRTLGITSAIDPDNRRRMLVLHCNEVVAATAPTYPTAGGG